MDSLTQIVLGAACGEVALGKKIGNKAQLFGAIGGTIPDLDVIVGNLFFGNEIDQLAFHRGFMHSFVFAFIAPLVLGFVVYELYNWGKRKDTTTLKDWIWLFFLSIFTHPILDSFTAYGTQLFLPFSDYRVAFNNISVVDVFYTAPFLFCLLVVLFFKRNNPKRLKWTKAGIYISSFYLLLTVGNKFYTNSVFEESFKEAGIETERFTTQPAFFTNFLWYGVAKTNNTYYVKFYSIFDDENRPQKLISIPANHELLDMNHPDLQTLTWFSKGFYALDTVGSAQEIRYKDLRFPLLDENNKNSSLFSFDLIETPPRWDSKPPQLRNYSLDEMWLYSKKLVDRSLGN